MLSEISINYTANIVFLIYNIFVFILYGYDKAASKTGKVKLRISEKALITLAALFGGLGAFCGMYIFRHKTKHKNFKILIPTFLIIQVLIVILIYI